VTGGGEWLAERFEESRPRLRAVAYRMLGSTGEADDAVQEAWLRLSRADAAGIENLGAWLTTVVGRVCLDVLRARRQRGEVPLSLPEVTVTRADADPEREAVLAGAVGLALLVVLETLEPAERLAFVLHDLFGVPFDEIAPVVGRTPAAARQLASRARRRVRGARAVPDADRAGQRRVVDAFLAASHQGDLGALLAVLDPDVVLRVDSGAVPPAAWLEVRGADAVAGRARSFRDAERTVQPVFVNGAPGFVSWLPDGRAVSVLAFTVRGGRITHIDVIAEPERLEALALGKLRV